jgi:hypothetical protein
MRGYMDILRRARVMGDHQIWQWTKHLVFWSETNGRDM